MFIRNCLICENPAQKSNICLACFELLPILPQTCVQCAEILHENEISSLKCHRCSIEVLPFERCLAAFPYQFPIGEFVSKLKFQGQLSYANFFAQAMINKITSFYEHSRLPEVIMPIPLHRKRLKERGFNQALEIAKPIAKYFHLPLDYKSVIRIRHTQAQSLLVSSLRKENVQASFQCHQSYSSKLIAVVDDVVTTGYTIRAFCEELKRNGAGEIHIWCCARAQLPS